MNMEEMKDILRNNEVTVTFIKKDGVKRVMRCTRDMDVVPSDKHPHGGGPVKTGVISVFDLDIQEWRSFNPDSVTSFIIN